MRLKKLSKDTPTQTQTIKSFDFKGGNGGLSNLSQAIKDLQGKMITRLLILC